MPTPDQYTTFPKTYPSGTPQMTGNTPPNPPAPNTASPGAPKTAPTMTNPYNGTPINMGPVGAMAPPAAGPKPWAPKAYSEQPQQPSAPTAPAPLYGSDMESKINTWLTGIMGGEGQTFSPALMGSLRGRLFSSAQGGAQNAINAAQKDAISRGMFRSGLPTDAILQAKANAGQNFTKAETDLESQAAQANSAQKMSALSALENALQGNRDFYLKDYQAKKPTPGPDYNSQLMGLIGGLQGPEF